MSDGRDPAERCPVCERWGTVDRRVMTNGGGRIVHCECPDHGEWFAGDLPGDRDRVPHWIGDNPAVDR